jgi:UDP-N-acetylmuramate dehydrogenase
LRYTEKEGERGIFLHAGAAALLPKLARQSVKRGYTGLEFAEGVPGTVGGAVTMNAGAYGAEMERVVEEIEAMTPGGETLLFHRADLSFRYRGSSLPANLVITAATFRLEHGDGENERRKIEEFRKRRKLAQPSGSPNAGSIFRNPPGDYAGRLVETAGLKGLRRGQAQVSTRHGNFIVNLGGARSEEIRSLMEEVRAGVREKTGVELEPEIRFVGEWPGNP